ncbi:MAG: T9SS type A sorting domain-containing protein [Bacteroidota bacterium]|nr:T9SS type A sorting domain-containing protein [Bacteroidota bacterium]
MKKTLTFYLIIFLMLLVTSGLRLNLYGQITSWKPAFNDNGYANPCSITKGDTIKFHISTTHNPMFIQIFKLGVNETLVSSFSNIPGGHRSLPDSAWEKGCKWPVSFSLKIPDSWASGAYAARFPVDTGLGTSTILFYVREKNPGSYGNILVVIPYLNWVAYNTYGGKNVYDENSTFNKRAFRVSFNRPFFGGGYAEFRSYPYKMIQWLENNNMKYEVATELDLHLYSDLLSNYKVVIEPGHAEYWTKMQRLNVENYVKNGGKYLSLSGNTCWWQVRIEDNDSTLVCYKNRYLDPLNGKIDSLVTVNWYDQPLNLPENFFLGASFRYAGYVDDINHKDFTHAQGFGGFSVHNSQHWIYRNTGLNDGEIFGRDPKDSLSSIVGYETDGALFSWDNGLPKPIGRDGTPKNFRILGISPAIGQGDTIENRHSTMGIMYNKNGGAVFNASSIYWTYGLPKDLHVQTITKNIIEKFMDNRFPPDIVSWSPFKLVTDTVNAEVISINKRLCDAKIGEKIKFSLKAEDPYNEKVKYFWIADSAIVGMDSTYEFTAAKEGTSKVTAYAYNSKDTSSISWDVNITQPTAIGQDKKVVLKYELQQNYPNPFNPSTIIKYSLANESNVKLMIYNAIGQIISTLEDKVKKAGNYEVKWNAGEAVSSGIYFYSLEASAVNGKENFRSVKKMIFLK